MGLPTARMTTVALIRHGTSNRIQTWTRTGSTHRQANSGETSELHTLTARNNVDFSMTSLHTTQASDADKGTSINSIRPRSVRQHKHRWSGWRFGVTNFAIWASLVFLINFIVTIWGSVSYTDSEGVLNEGDCGQTKTLNAGLHVLINILSTILLSGSNYCMQCLSAPTRGEIDKAHHARKWLDIGIPSFRNLRHISRSRLVLWILLAISSLPLHLL